MSEQHRLVAAFAITFAILFGFNMFFDNPVQTTNTQQEAATFTLEAPEKVETKIIKNREEALSASKRVTISGERLSGSINLKGGRLDDITLIKYKEGVDEDSAPVKLLSPADTPNGYYVDFGWQGIDKKELPNKDTLWQVKTLDVEEPLTSTNSITLYYDNENGLRFERTFTLDENYLFTVNDKVINTHEDNLELSSYAQNTRNGDPKTQGYLILHEGPVGVINNKLEDPSYEDISKETLHKNTTGGWFGFTDKYWLVALIPSQDVTTQIHVKGDQLNHHYTNKITYPTQVLKGNDSIERTHYVFTGAKELGVLDAYEEKHGFKNFDLAVDFGWFYFLTKPLFFVMEALNKLLGNFGLAILVLTVLFKLLTYPLARKSFYSMARMKVLQPKMEAIKVQYGNDKMRLNQELMTMYQKEKINPMSGCMPILLQAPIFFCLYKVFFVTIEMRHAPFFGWIHDLSAPDPTSVFNLFGLIPVTLPEFLIVGAWPLIMGLSMVLQQKLAPSTPTDPAQAKVMMIMPIVFTYMLASFPVGLVIYWTWNNILTIIQQYWISRYAGDPKIAMNSNKKVKK